MSLQKFQQFNEQRIPGSEYHKMDTPDKTQEYKIKLKEMFNNTEQLKVGEKWLTLSTGIIINTQSNSFIFRVENPKSDRYDRLNILIDKEHINIFKDDGTFISQEIVDKLISFVKKSVNYLQGSDAYPVIVKIIDKLTSKDRISLNEKI